MNDLRFALRQLIKSPLFTTIAVLSLALGIGANTAIFSLINAVLLRGLPVTNPHELRLIEWSGHNARLSNFRGGPGGNNGSFPYPVFEEFSARVSDSAIVFGFASLWNLNVLGPDGASTGAGLLVSGNFFAGYGATTLIGRPIGPEDDRPDAPPVAVITYRWWERHFGADPNVLSHTISVNRHSYTIVGVLPRNFAAPNYGDAPDIYVPMAAQPQLHPDFPLASNHHWWMQMMARLAPGTNEARLKAAFDVAFLQTLHAPDQGTTMDDPAIVLADGSRGPAGIRRFIALPLLGLLTIVTVVLLVACANLAGLLVARGAARRHEMAVRSALGASRWRLVKQSLTEALLLALAGGGLGLLLAAWGRSALLLPLLQVNEGFQIDLQTDGRVLLFTLVISFVTAITAGLLPALRGSRVDPSRDLADGFRTGGSRQRLGRVLVATQMGLSTLLVVAAALLGRSLLNLVTVDPGFITENLLVFRFDAGSSGIPKEQRIQFFDRVRQQLAALPGVRAVTLSDHSLLSRQRAANGISLPGSEPAPDVHLQADQLTVGDGFFATMGIPLLLGREFTARDNEAGGRVAVVNERFVRTFLGDAPALGKSFNIGKNTFEIVGVCGDAKYTDLRRAIEPTMYLPFRQHSREAMYFEVRSVLSPMSLVPAARQAVAAIDPNIPLAEITTQADLARQSIFVDRLASILCGLLALLALGLTCIGLYGLMAYHVARRTREIGVRVALGATPGRISGEILREAVVTAIWGLVTALPLSFGLAAAARAIFYGVSPYDPFTFVGAAVALLAIAALAAWVPARRAARVDPLIALRAE